jgi:hypothetical protein
VPGYVPIAGLVLLVIATKVALIVVIRRFSFSRLVSVLGGSFLLFAAALAIVTANWECAFGCRDINILAKFVTLTFSLDSIIGYITDGAIFLLLLTWGLELIVLYRQHRRTWFWGVLLAPIVSWSIAVVVVLTHLPNVEEDIISWIHAIVVASVCLFAGYLVIAVAAFRGEMVQAV